MSNLGDRSIPLPNANRRVRKPKSNASDGNVNQEQVNAFPFNNTTDRKYLYGNRNQVSLESIYHQRYVRNPPNIHQSSVFNPKTNGDMNESLSSKGIKSQGMLSKNVVTNISKNFNTSSIDNGKGRKYEYENIKVHTELKKPEDFQKIPKDDTEVKEFKGNRTNHSHDKNKSQISPSSVSNKLGNENANNSHSKDHISASKVKANNFKAPTIGNPGMKLELNNVSRGHQTSKFKESGNNKTINPFNGLPYSYCYQNLLNERMKLPVWGHRNQFMEMLKKNQVLVVVGETGSGKTTQIPQWCVEYLSSNKQKMVACTQPRRVAAVSVAQRVAQEVDVTLGAEVGYKIRFENCTTEKTLLKYTTDGMLLREAINDPMLKNHGIVLLDEVHERTTATDILLGLLKDILTKRKELKLMIMSAMLHADKFTRFFDNAPLINIQGNLYPVDINYELKPNDNYLNEAIEKVIEVHTTEKTKGDILVFLTGQSEIEYACELITEKINKLGDRVGELACIPLYSALPLYLQRRAFESPPADRPNGAVGRKVILSTNIAEASLTIDGLSYVIDSGFSKQKRYNTETCIESLTVTQISKTNAIQRSGRAGRTGPGKCFRLYTEEEYERNMTDSVHPEILSSNLASVVLTLKRLGLSNLNDVKLIDPLTPKAYAQGIKILNEIEALEENGNLTDLGKLLVEFPLDPRLSKLLLVSCKYDCTDAILSIASMLSVAPCFVRPKKERKLANLARSKFQSYYGDHLTLLNVYQAFEDYGKDYDWCYENYLNYSALITACEIKRQLTQIMRSLKVQWNVKYTLFQKDIKNILKVITSTFFMNVAKHKVKKIYLTMDNKEVYVHPSSSMITEPEWVVYNECIQTTKLYIKNVSQVMENAAEIA